MAIVVLVTPNTSIYKIRGGEHSPPLPSCLAIYRCTHDIEIGFLSYISIGIEIISDDYSIFCSFLCGLKFNVYFCHVVYSYDRMK